MLPLLDSQEFVAQEADAQSSVAKSYLSFLQKLKSQGFSGDIETQYSSRLAVATDNSIYQRLPQAVIHPKSVNDLQIVGALAAVYTDVKFSARGGGTGTNGQSLTQGIVVDISRHMNKILEINSTEGWVKVQTGVVKDQLNDALRPHGFFFAPDLSTSNRATIGGMINTDASGQGSLVYGKTSDHVLELTSVLVDGTVMHSTPVAKDSEQTVRYNEILQQIKASCIEKRDKVLAKFPRLNRFLTGYDLEHAVSDDLQTVDVSRILAGSEGSLAFIAEAKLNITPIPKNKVLINIKYDSFESALRHAPSMVAAQATSVETIDSKVLNLAREDIVWHSVSDYISEIPGKTIDGLNMVEYNDDSRIDIDNKINSLKAMLDLQITSNEAGVIGYQITEDLSAIGKIYGMRKKSVGLLGKAKGWQKPIAFAEDTAVPPENLADFIIEFRALLDAKGLQYGMFGHVDAGVLHVRPALDMCDPNQTQLMQDISNEVVALVSKYCGLMWGEHGKGYRSEYSPAFFGDELFTELRKIKTVFDPHNQMNPGKICTPIDSKESLVKVSDVKRGDFDVQIPIAVRDSFAPAMSCNGNGLCFNYDTKSPMCPSSKVTRDRRHSPKGRAGMMREWLRLLANKGVDVALLEDAPKASFFTRIKNSLSVERPSDFSEEVFEVMDHCLACKACTNQCPINVDVPTFRARFLSMYYQRYNRPFKDLLVANIESMAPFLAKFPTLHNSFLRMKWFNKLLKKTVGYVDPPILSKPTLTARLQHQGIEEFDLNKLSAMSQEQRKKFVLIVQDPFTSYYEAKLVEDLVCLVKTLNLTPVVLPFKPNGKPQHVKGFLKEFAITAKNAADFLNQIHKLSLPMVGVDPSLVLCYRDEYKTVLGKDRGDFKVLLVHEWLAGIIDKPQLGRTKEYVLFAHCTEKTMLAQSEKQWQMLFADFGLTMKVEQVGCCGMAGTFGHEAKHMEESIRLFEMSWQQPLSKYKPSQIMATGYSCRSQVARLEQFKPRHPLQVLLKHIEAV